VYQTQLVETQVLRLVQEVEVVELILLTQSMDLLVVELVVQA
jgi:hypothetical protein